MISTAPKNITTPITRTADARVSAPWLPALLLAGADATALMFVFAGCVLLRQVSGGLLDPSMYWQLWPLLAFQVCVYALFGLYPGILYHPVTELRRLSAATTAVFLSFSVLLFLFRATDAYSRLVFFFAWALSMIAVPTARLAVRAAFSRREWWGFAAVVFGAGDSGRSLIEQLRLHPEYGFRVRLWMDPDARHDGRYCGIPVVREAGDAAQYARRAGVSHAIVAMPDQSRPKFLALLESDAATFKHLLIVPNLGAVSTVGIEAGDLCRQLTLEVRRSLLLPGARLAKRFVDVLLAVSAGTLVLPLLLPVALLLKRSGSVFYRQTRLGRGGRPFHLWKFRTMRPDAEAYLAGYLAKHPEKAEEWERDHKLRNDPRVTPIGRILRKTSLDEIPQLWNVIRGDMSLVGPRPIVFDEIPKYGPGYPLYTQVLPGVTGLWQVSGRNDASYIERVALDSYYIRNWSVWFDLYVLGRTVRAVLVGSGAY